MRDKNQKLVYNQVEMELFERLFKDNEDLIYLVRKVMLQGELTDLDRQNLAETMRPEVLALLSKHFHPKIDVNAPLGQISDLGFSIGSEIKSLSPDGAWPFIKAKEIAIEYLDQQLKVLAGDTSSPKIVLSELVDLSGFKAQREQKYTDIIAWNWIVNWIELNSQTAINLARKDMISPEERAKIVQKNSAQ